MTLLPTQSLFAESTKPVTIDAELHGKLKVLAPGEEKLLVALVAEKLGELLEPNRLAAFMAGLPAKSRRCGNVLTAQVYLQASMHTWLKTVAASHGRPLYQLVEQKLWELVTPV